MKITKNFRGLPENDLSERLKEFKKELLKLSVQVTTGTAAQSSGKIRQLKKNVARIATIVQERGKGTIKP